jgi:hypothetical protein
VHEDWRDRLLANVADRLIAIFFHDEFDQHDPDELKHLRGSTMRRLFDLLYSAVLRLRSPQRTICSSTSRSLSSTKA